MQNGELNRRRRNKRLETFLVANEHRYGGVKVGRDKKRTIDLDNVNAMAKVGCTLPEMAAILGVSLSWLTKEKDGNPHMALAIEQGEAELRQSLRRTQITLALDGHASMLMWLGKQYLGQSDKQEMKTQTEVSVTVKRALDELREMPRDRLLEAQAVLDGAYEEIDAGSAEVPAP